MQSEVERESESEERMEESVKHYTVEDMTSEGREKSTGTCVDVEERPASGDQSGEWSSSAFGWLGTIP